MSDENVVPIWNAKYRRRKKFQGATWTPENAAANIGDGPWCKACKTRHGYMTLSMSFEKRGQQWFTLWACKKTGNVVEEMGLGERG